MKTAEECLEEAAKFAKDHDLQADLREILDVAQFIYGTELKRG